MRITNTAATQDVTTTSGAASRKWYAVTPAPTAVASRTVSRLSAEAFLAVARASLPSFFDIVTFTVSPPLGPFYGALLRTEYAYVVSKRCESRATVSRITVALRGGKTQLQR